MNIEPDTLPSIRGEVVSFALWRQSLRDAIPLDGLIAGIFPGYVRPRPDPKAAAFWERQHQLHLRAAGVRGRLLHWPKERVKEAHLLPQALDT